MNPKRGELYWVDFNPVNGSEQARIRPALVVQNDRGNASARTTVVVPLSTGSLPKLFPFTVALTAGEGSLPRASYVNCAQIKVIALERLGDRIGALDQKRMEQVNDALRYELDL